MKLITHVLNSMQFEYVGKLHYWEYIAVLKSFQANYLGLKGQLVEQRIQVNWAEFATILVLLVKKTKLKGRFWRTNVNNSLKLGYFAKNVKIACSSKHFTPICSYTNISVISVTFHGNGYI